MRVFTERASNKLLKKITLVVFHHHTEAWCDDSRELSPDGLYDETLCVVVVGNNTCGPNLFEK
ncbi:hypothetical protein DPMN_060894 [Dreissena polymorpha]|uniref:Uncharacterized protein n=1 Tax=Dreissena polymorpha TaxID=45954 RepID=A0A9D4C6T1_DREPO|nr:hypothetical protein DPMN_060894 [Dreissena polymorpha]